MAKNKGPGEADTQPEALNESAAIGLDDLAQTLMGKTEVVTETDAESEQAEVEVKDAEVAESEEEVTEQDVLEEDLEEESEEDSEDVSEDESQEVSAGVQKKIDKRIGRLTARAKDAEERAREAEEKLDDARTELDEIRDHGEKGQVVSDNPHAGIRTLKDLKGAKTKARELRAWCRRHRDGTVVTVNGIERDYDSSQIADLELKAQEDLEEHLPAREEFIKGEQEQSSMAEKAFPWWKNKSSSEYQAAMSVLRDAPMIRQLPNWKATVAFYLMGVNEYQRQTDSAKKSKPKAKAKAPTKVATRPAKAPAPIADTNAARYEDARSSFAESGSTEALANMFAVK